MSLSAEAAVKPQGLWIPGNLRFPACSLQPVYIASTVEPGCLKSVECFLEGQGWKGSWEAMCLLQKFVAEIVIRRKLFAYLVFSFSLLSSFSFTYLIQPTSLPRWFFLLEPRGILFISLSCGLFRYVIFLSLHICLLCRLPTFQDLWTPIIYLNI